MERESQETLNSSSKFEFKIECHSEWLSLHTKNPCLPAGRF